MNPYSPTGVDPAISLVFYFLLPFLLLFWFLIYILFTFISHIFFTSFSKKLKLCSRFQLNGLIPNFGYFYLPAFFASRFSFSVFAAFFFTSFLASWLLLISFLPLFYRLCVHQITFLNVTTPSESGQGILEKNNCDGRVGYLPEKVFVLSGGLK